MRRADKSTSECYQKDVITTHVLHTSNYQQTEYLSKIIYQYSLTREELQHNIELQRIFTYTVYARVTKDMHKLDMYTKIIEFYVS